MLRDMVPLVFIILLLLITVYIAFNYIIILYRTQKLSLCVITVCSDKIFQMSYQNVKMESWENSRRVEINIKKKVKLVKKVVKTCYGHILRHLCSCLIFNVTFLPICPCSYHYANGYEYFLYTQTNMRKEWLSDLHIT